MHLLFRVGGSSKKVLLFATAYESYEGHDPWHILYVRVCKSQLTFCAGKCLLRKNGIHQKDTKRMINCLKVTKSKANEFSKTFKK
jgi:hypothetical protein